MIDRGISRRFWGERAQLAADPRSVTLDRESPRRAAREVAHHQRWMFRQLEAIGCRPDSVGDLGCGNGDWTVALARRARSLFVVDFSEEFLGHTRSRLAALGSSTEARFVASDVATVALPPGLDLVVAGAVTQYLDDEEVHDLLRRIAAALGPGGVLYLRTTVAKRVDRLETRTTAFQGIYRRAGWYRAALHAASFRVERDALATDYMADEIGLWLAGRWLWPLVAWPLRLIRRIYRRWRPTDVYACLARPSASAMALGNPSIASSGSSPMLATRQERPSSGALQS